MNNDNKKIVVGFSGGVDSASAVRILREQGFEQVAVFLKMFADQDLRKIERLADKIGVELIVRDISDIFKGCVIKGFLDEYKKNRTPNPCVRCNTEIKFKTLLEVAREVGAEKVATGHYARVQKNGEIFELLKGIDEKKDQSYFLYRLTQEKLSRIVLPLGDKNKKEIKKAALEAGWFEKIEESQDVCFLDKEKKVQDFLKKNLDSDKNQPGKIEDEEGNVLGEHQGLAYYTQGQRKGLDLAGGPFYVIEKDLKRNVLLVTKNKDHQSLTNDKIFIEDVSWAGEEPVEEETYQFKSRYRSSLVPGKFKKIADGWAVDLEKPQWAVAVGQSLVAYDGDKVVGGGVIVKS